MRKPSPLRAWRLCTLVAAVTLLGGFATADKPAMPRPAPAAAPTAKSAPRRAAKPARAKSPALPAPEPQPAPAQQLQTIIQTPAYQRAPQDPNLPRLRADWFQSQRAYPFDHIPADAFQKALAQRDLLYRQQHSGKTFGAAGIVTFPGDGLWHPLGPQPTDDPFGGNGGSPTASGRVTAMAVDTTDATGNTVYLGGAAGGVWKTTDGGAHWTALTDTQPSLAVGSIAIDPNNHLTIYVGTGEENFSGDAYYGAGILKSTDGGTTWTQLGASVFAGPFNAIVGGAKIGAIAVQPGNSNIVLAAVTFVDGGTIGGIYRSTDAGTTWNQVSGASAPVGASGTAVVFDPAGSLTTTATVYAAMGDPFPSGNTANGIYKSTDSGVTWTKLAGGLPTTNLGRIQLGYAPSTTGATAQIYAAIADSSNSSFLLQGFFVTKDGGTSWTQLTNTPDFCKEGTGGGQCYYDMAIGVHPTNPNFLVVGGAAYGDNSTTLFKSTDGGTTWSTDSNTPASDFTLGSTTVRPHVDTHVVMFAPTSGTPILYTGDDGGVWKTADPTPANPVWVDLNATLGLSQFYPGATASVSDENYGFGGTQDNDIQTFSGTLDWTETGICGDGGGIAVDSTTPTTIYGACNLGSPFKVIKSVLYGMNLSGPVQSFAPAETAITASGDRMQFIPPLTIDPENPSALYFGTCRVWQTTNATGSWAAISGDLTAGNLPGTCGAGSQNITTLSVSAKTSANVLVGTTNGKVWQTTSFGALWNEIDNSLLPNRHVTAVRYKPTDSTGQIAYVTVSGFQSGHVFKTTNGGTSWADISGNLPDTPVNDIIVDHTPLPAFDALYIATDVGVFSCPDPESATPCTNWTVIGDPLPNSPVLALSMRDSTRILHAYTHGRGSFFTQLRDEQLPPLPLLSSLTPAAVMAYSPTTNVTVQGANFSANTVALLGGLGSAQGVTTTVLSTTQLTMSINSSLLTTGIVFPVTLSDPLGVEPQQGLPFTVMNPIPTMSNLQTSLSPFVVGEPVTLTFTGTGFVNGTQATLYTRLSPLTPFGSPISGTASNGGTTLVVTIPGTALTTPVPALFVSSSNPLPGGGPATSAFGGPSIVANAGPEAAFVPSAITFFPGQDPGTPSAVSNVEIMNTGGATLTFPASATSIIGPNHTEFAVVAPFPAAGHTPACDFTSGSGSVTVGNFCWFGMTFSPPIGVTPGIQTATLQVSDNDSDNGDPSPQNVSILGLANGPIPFVSPNPLNFGSVPKGTASTPGNVTVTNFGSGAISLNVASVSILPSANSADFAVGPTSGSPACSPLAGPFSLASSVSCGEAITFTPSIIGAETAILRVTFSNSATASIDVTLNGTGVAPVITSISPAGVATGGPPFTLTVNGVDFVFGATVNFNGTALLTTFVSSTQLLASVPASDIAAAGSFGITATNPAGGGTSEPKTLVVAAAPTGTNDDFNNAIDTGATPYRTTEDTTLMTTNTGGRLDPTPACAPGGASLSGKAKSAWFKFVATATGKVEADTRFSGYATILSVWTGAPGSFTAVTNGCASGNVAGSPAESLVGFNVTSGTTYFLMVTDVAGVGGTLTFSLDFASAAPANDDWASATTATASYTNTVNTILATINTGGHADPTPACAPGGAVSGGISNSVWYTFVAGSSGTVTADTLTSPYDTILSVWTGAPGSFSAVANGCNDNAATGIAQSQMSFSVTSGTTYYLMVTALLGDGGTTNFHLNFAAGAPATTVKVETKPDGTGTLVPAQNVPAGTSVTGYAISRDAGGNFVANVAATWSLVSTTGGVVGGDLVPAGDTKSATFTGHLAGTAAMHAVVGGLTSTDSGTLTVVAGAATVVNVETAANGSGTVVGAQNVSAGSSVTGFAISRDAGGNFVANVAGTWSLTNVTGGVVQGDLVTAGGGLNATFTGHLLGTATIHVTSGALTAGNSGTLTVIAGAATVVNVETAANGSGTVVGAQNVSAGSSVTGFAISRDALGNFVANAAGVWSLTNVTGGVVQGDLVAAGGGLSATFTGHLVGTATIHVTSGALTGGNSGTLTVVAGAATVVNVETAANGSGTVLAAQNVSAGSSVTGFAISRDAGGNFVANVAGVWSLTNVTGGVVQGDLVAAGGGLNATFTGHLLGTATIHVTSGALTAGNSGTLTVIAGAATVVNVETAANGSGTVVSAQNVTAGSSVTGFAISRDASGNFVANVAGVWSLTNVTGGVLQGDLVAAGGGLNATFTGHLVGAATIHVTSGALTAGNSGTLTIIAGAATVVKVETAANGSGTVLSAQNVPEGSSVTGFAIGRDAGGNFVANVAGTWSLTNVTGGVVQGDLVAAGGGLNATFTGHLVGTATIHVTSGALTAGNSGTLTVVAGAATVVNVETAANGSGTVVGAQNVPAGSSVTGFAISRDALGNFVANVAGVWSLTNVTGGVVQGDLVAAGGGLNATFTGHAVGTATIHVTSGALTAGNSGTLSVIATVATVVNVETAANGSGAVLAAQNVSAGSSVTGFAISRDALGNFIANVAGTWSLTNVTGGVVQGDLVAAGGGLSATFTGHLVGTATIHVTSGALTPGNSGTLTVVATAATVVNVETAANGTGTVLTAQNVPAGSSVTGYAISRDGSGNFIANVAGAWSLTNVTGGVVQGDLVPAGGGLSATFTGHLLGTATIHVTSGALTAGNSGTLTVVAGAATVVNVETAANGSGTVVGAQNIPAGSSVTGYAISRDAGGNFIANVAGVWSLTNVTGGVVQGDLVAAGGGLSATFTGHLVGTATIHVTSGALTGGNSGTLTVVAGAATVVNVETAANGSGTVLAAQNVSAGSSVTGFAISRDAGGNFVANVAGVWSLTNVTGGVVQGDLVAAGGGLNATFTGHLLGTATIHVTSGALTAGNSGTLTVIAGAATVVNVETAANGSGTVVSAQNVTAGSSVTGFAISRDASGNFVANVAGVWSLTNVTGGVLQGDLVAAGGGLNATFTGHLVGAATIHVTSGALTAGNSGTLTIIAGAATVVKVETAANGSGTVLSAQNVPEGSSVTGFAIGRDAGGNFVANVAGTWSLTNVTGGVVQGDLVAAGGGLNATFTGHLVGTATIHVTSGALTAGNSGTLTVVAGAATVVNVETAANGSGTVVGAQNVPAGSSVTGFAISRDALGNFVANVAGVWSLTNVTGGVVQGDLVAAGGGLNATFTGHAVGTATIHVTSGALTAGNSGTLSVIATVATVVNVETAANGSGAVLAAQNVSAGSSVTGFAISRDALGNFIANVAGTWSLTNVTGGVVQGDLVAAGGGLSATFTGHLVGTATIHVTSGALTPGNSGTLTVVATAATVVNVETAANGTGTVLTAQNVPAGSSVTGYAISRDGSGNFIANVAGAWSLTNVTGGVVQGDLVPAGGGLSATFTGHLLGTATIRVTSGALTAGNSGTLTVLAGAATVVNVETAANGSGAVVGTQNVPAGSSVTGYAISRDAGGNFVANVAGTWSLTNVTGGVVQGDLVVAGGGLNATFTGHLVGTATIHVTSGALTAANSGTLTVLAGAATVVNVETAANGSGTVVGAQNVSAGSSVTGFAISRDAGGNFLANVAGTWSLTNVTGGVVQGDLVAAGGGLNATITGHLVGTATIHVTSGALTAGNSGTLTVVAGAATAMRVETLANGGGTVVGAQNVPAGSSVTGYAISRDALGNFVANAAGVWSLTNVTGGVVQGDLVATGGGLNATFTGHLVGTAMIHVTSGALTAGNSGTLTVVTSAATVVNVETAANGSGTVLAAQNVSAGSSVTGFAISRDAGGNFIANVAGTWSLTNVTGGVVQGDLVAAGGGLNATFTGHLVGTAMIHVTSGALAPGNSGTLTVVAGTAASIAATAGTPQSATASNAFAVALAATVKDASGNLVPNVLVTFTAPVQAGASGTFAGGINTATTNANGVATALTFTANANGGAYVVNATVAGVAAPAPFALTNVDFTVSLVTPGTVQITAGTPSNIPLNLNTTPAGLPLPAAVNYTCTVPATNTGGMPLTGVTCVVMPASTPAGTVGGSAAANSTLMITTTANLPPAPQRRSPRAPYLPWASATTLAGLLAMYLAGRQKFAALEGRAGYATLALLVITAGGLVGCATMSTASVTPTPKGAASITVTATSGGDVKPMVININVN